MTSSNKKGQGNQITYLFMIADLELKGFKNAKFRQ